MPSRSHLYTNFILVNSYYSNLPSELKRVVYLEMMLAVAAAHGMCDDYGAIEEKLHHLWIEAVA